MSQKKRNQYGDTACIGLTGVFISWASCGFGLTRDGSIAVVSQLTRMQKIRGMNYEIVSYQRKLE